MSTIAAAQDVVPVFEQRRRRPLAALWQIARRNPVGAVAAAVCVALVVMAVFAPAIAPHPADKVGFPRLHAPSAQYPFGTDNLFRDMFSRIIIGSRISLGVGFTSVLIGTTIGTLLGLISGYVGGWVDIGVNRLTDTVMAFPPLILAIFVLSIFKPSFLSVSIAIGVIIAPTTARIVRGSVLSVRTLQYVNVAASIIVIASIQIGNAILAEAALSFLSLGIATDSHPSWGKMLQDTRQVWQAAWWTAVVPGAAISLAVLSFNLMGDALRDVLDPRLRGS